MKVAIIDLGTNTFHLLLAEVKGDTHEIYHRERKAVKIGEKGINEQYITQAAWTRAIDTIKSFYSVVKDESITKIYATATSAIRNAKNGSALVKEIKDLTGINTEIISGTREAELILLGVRRAIKLNEEKNLIMDIGGGSIEFIIADQSETYWLRSYEIGGQRLVEKFHQNDPISKDEIDDLYTYFSQQLSELEEVCNKYQIKTLVGCSGTFDTLSDIYRIDENIDLAESETEYPLTLTAFKKIYEDLIYKSRSERLAIPGMIEMRVDMIVVACVLIHYLLEKLDFDQIRVSAYALKEGVLTHRIEEVQKSIASNS